MKYNPEELKEIPKRFHSFVDEKPFTNCVDCDKNLLTEDTEYLIERICKNHKGYNASDVIFDYAICMDCAMKLHQEMSKESRAALMEYFSKNLNQQKVVDLNSSIEDRLSNCMVSDIKIEDCEEYQVCAHCVGDKIYLGNPPYMVSGQVLEKIMHVLSNETLDILNGFYQKIRTPTPGIYEPDPRPVLF